MPSCVVPSNTVTLLLASAVPFRVTTLAGEAELLLITGAVGATVSTVTARAADAALVVPDTVSVAVKLCVAVRQRRRRIAPRPARVGRRGADRRRSVEQIDRAVRRRRASQRERGVVGDAVAGGAAVRRERRNGWNCQARRMSLR